MTASTRITATYLKLPENIREIAETVRAIIHKAAPTLEESWKWGPCFEKNGIAIGLWGFKKHVSVVFYRGSEMSDKHQLFNDGFDNAHNRMIKFTSLKEVNAKKLGDYVKEAAKLNATSGKSAEKVTKQVEIPKELAAWLSKNKKAKTFYDSISFTYRREITAFLTGAKQETTRKRRFKKVTEALKSGKKDFRRQT